MIGIYKITNRINGKCYIGQSNDIERRFVEHKCRAKKSNNAKSLKLAFAKYGIENFSFEIIETIDVEDREKLNELEIKYIKELKPEYNRNQGGSGNRGFRVSDSVRETLREKGKQQWANMTEEQRNKIINNNFKRPEIGHTVSKETREKLRIANLGKTQSEETKLKRKETLRKKKENGFVKSNEGHKKKVRIIESDLVFNSVNECAEYIGASSSEVSAVLNGRRKSCRNCHIVYVV